MSKLGNLILGLLLRSRNNAQLLHHAQLVHVVPTFHHFALLGEQEDAYPRNHHLIASGSDASELALVGAASPPTGNDLVPFGYLILDDAMKIGEGLTELAHESFDVLGATFQGSAVGLVGDVPVEDLVRQVEVPLVRDLFDVAPKDGLVLFGHRSLLLPPAFTGGIISPTAMMPASEPRRTIGRACPHYPLALFTGLPRRVLLGNVASAIYYSPKLIGCESIEEGPVPSLFPVASPRKSHAFLRGASLVGLRLSPKASIVSA